MSRPIYEPSLERTDARLGFGSNQLFRRPSLASADTGIPWARRSRPYTAGVQTIGNASYDQLDVTTSDNMGTGESGEPYFEAQTTGSANGIVILQNCFVIITVSVVWDTNPSGAWWPWIGIDPLSGTQRIYQPQYSNQNTFSSKGRFTSHDRCDEDDVLTFGVVQISGGTRNLDAGFCEIAVLGTWTGANPKNIDPDDI